VTIENAFSAAWKDLKKTVSTVASFVIKHQSTIQTVVADVSVAAVTFDPGAAPVVTSLDALEEAVIGKIAALSQEAATAATLQTLFAEEWPSLQTLVKALQNHPTVASVTAALTPAIKAA
jgi:hypothetical protein